MACLAAANTGESEVPGENVFSCDLPGDHPGNHHDPVKGDWGRYLAFNYNDPLNGGIVVDETTIDETGIAP